MASSTFLATPMHRPLPLFLVSGVSGLAALLAHRGLLTAPAVDEASTDESVQTAA